MKIKLNGIVHELDDNVKAISDEFRYLPKFAVECLRLYAEFHDYSDCIVFWNEKHFFIRQPLISEIEFRMMIDVLGRTNKSMQSEYEIYKSKSKSND